MEYHTKAEVDRVIVDGTRATGIRLADGSTISADLVVSSLGVPQTVLRLLQDVDGLAADQPSASATSTTTAASCGGPTSPSTNRRVLRRGRQPGPRSAASPVLGPEGSRPLRHALQGRDLPRRALARGPFALTSCDTLWDPSRAPEGKHIIGVEEFGAPIRLFDKSQWNDIEKRFSEQLIEHWSHYAPNMTPDNVIAMRTYGPPDIFNGHPDMMEGGYSAGSTIAWQQGRYRPIPELSGYKMLLDNVYNCSSNMHSGSGIGRGSSVNCWNTIAADLALDPG